MPSEAGGVKVPDVLFCEERAGADGIRITGRSWHGNRSMTLEATINLVKGASFDLIEHMKERIRGAVRDA